MLENPHNDEVKTDLNTYLKMLENNPDMLVPHALAHLSWKTRYAAAVQHVEFPEILKEVLDTLQEKQNNKQTLAQKIMATAEEILTDEYVSPYFKMELAEKNVLAFVGMVASDFPALRNPSPFQDVRADKLKNG